jgi:hypothetical protein
MAGKVKRELEVGDLVKHAFNTIRSEFFIGIVIRVNGINGLYGILWLDGKIRFHSRIALKWIK